MRGSLGLGCVSLLVFAACSGGASKMDGNPRAVTPAAGSDNAGTGTTGGAGKGSLPIAGAGGASAGSSSGGSGGKAATGGQSGASAGGGSGGAGTGGGLGMAGGGGAGGSAAAGAGAGGSATAGSGGSGNSGGAGGAGGANVAGSGGDGSTCTRDLLKSSVDAYFKALAAHDASTLALADSVKFTENGKVQKLGQDGLWKTAGALKYSQSVLDTELCGTATEAVVPDGSMDIPFALRLKVVSQKITEVETIAVRPGDYSLASDTGAIIASADAIKWEESVPADDAPTRDQLTSWMDKYFKYFPNGVCNTDSSCKRLENGGGSFSCSAGASCASGSPPAKPQAVSHIILADVETGVGAGFDLFTGADTDMHMFKMHGGEVYAVHAVLGAATSTGWD